MLTTMAGKAKQDPLIWLQMTQIYGELASSTRFATAFEEWLTGIYRDGVEATVRRYINQSLLP
jgi:mannitol 2-dehydrogenase